MNQEIPKRSFPELPIVTPDSPRLSQREKYGSLFFLGLFGLLVAVGLVGWFAMGLWTMRDVWSNIYLLHNESRPEPDRVQAALALSRDPRVNQRQRWDICLRKPLPPIARYLLAESLTAEAATADARGYALTVARSPDWPGWLRILLLRPMAYATVEGATFLRPALEELQASSDRAVALWASFILAAEDPNKRAGVLELEQACERGPEEERELACLLRDAARRRGKPEEQKRLLDRATVWLRTHHPECRQLWNDWTLEGDRIHRK